VQVEVRLFGGLTERAGGNRVGVELNEPATVADLRLALTGQYPSLAPLLHRVKVAVDLEVADDEVAVTSDSELALLPPVAGGAGGGPGGPPLAGAPEGGSGGPPLAGAPEGGPGEPPVTRARIVTGISSPPLDVAGALSSISGPEVGGTATFLGTVRDHAPDLGGVVGLDYSTYPEMAEKVLAEIAAEIERDHLDVTGIALIHAVGELDVQDHTILIACAAAHRDPAFEACRDALERVKDRVPVWKRERTADGEHRWVGLHGAEPTPNAEP